MDNRKRIVNLEYFIEMMHICPRLHGQTFDELLFKEEILEFLRFLRHSGEIRKLTDVNINKLHQPWRSFAAVINKCLIASGAAPPKTKASVRKAKSSSETIITPPTATGTRLLTFVKGKQPANASKAKSLTVLFEVAMTEAEQIKLATKRNLQQTYISQASGSGADEGTGHKVSEVASLIQEGTDDEGNDDTSLVLYVGSKKGLDAEDDEDELYRDVKINLEGRDVQMTDVHTTQEFQDTHVTLSPFDGAVSFIHGIVQRYTDQRMSEAVKVAVHIQSNRLQDEVQAKNEEFLKNLNENIHKIIKEQVKEYTDQRMSEAVKVAVHIQSNRLQDEVQAKNEEFLKNLNENIHKIIKEQVKEPGVQEKMRRKRVFTSRGANAEKATKTTGKSTQGSKSQQKTTSESAPAEEPMQRKQPRPLASLLKGLNLNKRLQASLH
nr:hypothetical protein [Tanacetum cinerariifolium]